MADDARNASATATTHTEPSGAPLLSSDGASPTSPPASKVAEVIQPDASVPVGKIPPDVLLSRLVSAWEAHEKQQTARLTLLVVNVIKPMTLGLLALAGLIVMVAAYALHRGQADFARDLLTHTIALAAGLSVGILVRTKSEQ